jgi:hypothetical protein
MGISRCTLSCEATRREGVLGLVLLGSCEPWGVLSHVQHMTKILVGLSLRRDPRIYSK